MGTTSVPGRETTFSSYLEFYQVSKDSKCVSAKKSLMSVLQRYTLTVYKSTNKMIIMMAQ